MIISHKNKFVFIHIAKNAGMFVTSMLKGQVGFNGIVIDGPRIKVKGNFVRQFLLNNRRKNFDFKNIQADRMCRYEFLKKHSFSSEIRMVLPEYNRYRRFCVVRNPYDRAVSQYHYIKRFSGKMTNQGMKKIFDEIKRMSGFDEYVQHGLPRVVKENFFSPQVRYIEGDNVDIIRFENLEKELHELLKVYGLKRFQSADPVNTSGRERDYRKYYDSNSVDAIENIYADDLKEFGYCFS